MQALRTPAQTSAIMDSDDVLYTLPEMQGLFSILLIAASCEICILHEGELR
jgi:hypothetical protein